MDKHFHRVAHRGGSRLAPENTLAAFRHALTLPIDAIELDVHMSSDGHAIVFHDNTVERLTNGDGNILDLDFSTLRKLNAAAHFPGGWPEAQQIPTLHEVLSLAKGRTQVYVEIKTSKRDGVYGRYPHIVETVMNEIKSLDMLEQVLIISFDWGVFPQVKALAPDVEMGALVSTHTHTTEGWNPTAEHALDTLIAQVKALGCSWVNLDRTLCTDTMPSIFHQHNLKLGLWTVNDLADLRHFAAIGVDSLTTDRPDLFADM